MIASISSVSQSVPIFLSSAIHHASPSIGPELIAASIEANLSIRKLPNLFGNLRQGLASLVDFFPCPFLFFCHHHIERQLRRTVALGLLGFEVLSSQTAIDGLFQQRQVPNRFYPVVRVIFRRDGVHPLRTWIPRENMFDRYIFLFRS